MAHSFHTGHARRVPAAGYRNLQTYVAQQRGGLCNARPGKSEPLPARQSVPLLRLNNGSLYSGCMIGTSHARPRDGRDEMWERVPPRELRESSGIAASRSSPTRNKSHRFRDRHLSQILFRTPCAFRDKKKWAGSDALPDDRKSLEIISISAYRV
jgi:hypothetical protein